MARHGFEPDRERDARRLVELAVRYAQHGWPVVPLHTPDTDGCTCRDRDCGSVGKHPRTRHGLREASTDADQVRAWWARWPDANIGVTTGASSGLLVLDIDLPEGPASLAKLQAEHTPLPPTCEQRTGSGGRQLLFAHPGGAVGNRTGVLPGVDVRADGGYVVVPPSLHGSGDRYRWTARAAPADPPRWLLAVLERTRPSPAVEPVEGARRPLPAGTAEQRYAAAALQRELAVLSAAVEGTRNDTLNRAAFNLGQLVGAGLLEQQRVAAELERAATAIGLGEREIRRTIASGLTAGAQQPRTSSAARVPPVRDVVASPAAVRRLGARHR